MYSCRYKDSLTVLVRKSYVVIGLICVFHRSHVDGIICVLIFSHLIEGDVLSGTSSSGVHHAGVLEGWFGDHWWNGRTFVLVVTTLGIFAPLACFKRIGNNFNLTQLAILEYFQLIPYTWMYMLIFDCLLFPINSKFSYLQVLPAPLAKIASKYVVFLQIH